MSTVDAWETSQRDTPFVRAAAPELLRTADLLAGNRTCLALADGTGARCGRGGDESAAAARLGTSRGTLHQELRRHRPLTP